MENITIFTDASYHDGDKTAGGAFWAKGGSEGGIKRSGSFSIPDARCSVTAESLAALRGIGFLLEDPQFHALFERGRECRLILVTDCQTVKNLIDRQGGSIMTHPPLAEAYNQVMNHKALWGYFMKVNWVKAHNNDGTPRTWVNNWCDEQAKKARMILHRKWKQQGIESDYRRLPESF